MKAGKTIFPTQLWGQKLTAMLPVGGTFINTSY
jgi:hypothetical protein